MVDRATVTAYNGLERPVVTTIDGHRLELAPHAHGEVAIGSGHDIQVVTQASDGEPIESFAVPVGHAETQLVYTVAGATPLRSWTAVYGNVSPVPPQFLAPQRWQGAKEQFIFAAPPEKIESKSGGGTRTVLDAADDIAPQTFAGVAKSNPAFTNLVLAHVRFDAPGSSRLSDWLAVGAPLPGFGAALAARRAHFSGD